MIATKKRTKMYLPMDVHLLGGEDITTEFPPVPKGEYGDVIIRLHTASKDDTTALLKKTYVDPLFPEPCEDGIWPSTNGFVLALQDNTDLGS